MLNNYLVKITNEVIDQVEKTYNVSFDPVTEELMRASPVFQEIKILGLMAANLLINIAGASTGVGILVMIAIMTPLPTWSVYALAVGITVMIYFILTKSLYMIIICLHSFVKIFYMDSMVSRMLEVTQYLDHCRQDHSDSEDIHVE